NEISLKEHVASRLALKPDDKVIEMMDWLGLFSDNKIDNPQNSAATLLHLLLAKWEMKPADKDMVVMQHEVEYTHREKKIKLTSTMALKGDNREYSAMAKTVGLPIAVLARLVMNKKIT